MVDHRESPSVLSAGMEWASRITTLALEFTVPVLIGIGLDRWWRSSPVLTIIGAVLGFLFFMLHTLRMARELTAAADRETRRSR